MNYQKLINIRPKIFILFNIIIVIIVITSIIILNKEVYDVYNILGNENDGYLVLNIPITHSDTVGNMEKLYINNQEYSFKIDNISEILLDELNMINYQKYYISINSDITSNMVYKVTLYSNKERVIDKIKKIII